MLWVTDRWIILGGVEMKIIKRSGSEVVFDVEKIVAAIILIGVISLL